MLYRFLAYAIGSSLNLAAMCIAYYMRYRFAIDVGIFAQAVLFAIYTATEATILIKDEERRPIVEEEYSPGDDYDG